MIMIKPKCSTCARLGKECLYGTPTWVNTHSECFKVVNNENGNRPKSKEQLFQEIEYWKTKYEEVEKTEKSDASDKSLDNGSRSNSVYTSISDVPHESDMINFHEPQNATYYQDQNDEQLFSWSAMSVHKTNHYMELFLSVKFLLQYMLKNEIDPTLDDSSKWTLLFGANLEDSQAISNIKRLIQYRNELDIVPVLLDGADFSKRMIPNSVVKEIQSLLPNKHIFYMLLNHFFNNIFALRPIVDQGLFLDDVQRLVEFIDYDETAKLKCVNTMDISLLAMLLIILRYALISILVVDDIDLPENLLTLKKDHCVPVRAVSVAQTCLTTFAFAQKRTLHQVQALILLLYYYRDRPEDCLGSSLSQYHMLLGLAKESALAMGLHKDPTYYGIPSETQLANLRRRLWISINSLGVETQVLNGWLRTLLSSSTIKVKVPVMSFKSPLDQAEIDELTHDCKLGDIFNLLFDHINNINENPKLTTLVQLLNEASDYVDEHYPISSLSDLTNLEVDTQLYKSIAFKNQKILEKTLILNSIKIRFYQIICGYYEDNRFAKLEVFKDFHFKYIQVIFQALDISGGLLSNSFRAYLDPLKSGFAIYPLVTQLSYRVISALQATLLSIYHGTDLLICHLYMSSSGVDRDYYEELISLLSNALDNHVEILQKSVGSKTYSSLKIVCSSNINNHLLKSYRFNSLTRFCNYYDTIDNEDLNDEQFLHETKKNLSERGNSAIEQGIFSAHTQWLRMSSSYRAALNPEQREHFRFCSSVVNVSHINFFAELTIDEIDKMVNVFKQTPSFFPVLASASSDSSVRLENTDLRIVLDTVLKKFETQPGVDSLMDSVLKEANTEGSIQREVTPASLEDLDILFRTTVIKPKCSTCARLGKICKYEIPHWVNTHVESYTVVDKVDEGPKSREQLHKEIEFWKSKAENHTPPSTQQLNHISPESFKDSVGSHGSPLTSSSSDLIDLHEPHSSTYYHETDYEQLSPLNPLNIHKTDPYMELFLCSKFLVQKVLKNQLASYSNDISKWALVFGSAHQDENYLRNISNLIHSRKEMINSIPFVGALFTIDTISDYIVREAESLLPDKSTVYTLLDQFFENMWAMRPVVDKQLFLNDLERIVQFNNDGKNVNIKLVNSTDVTTLAMLLILLRYAFISISNVEEKDLPSKLLHIKRNTYIPVKTVSVAYLCISALSAGEKRTLHLVQALVLLLFYFKDRSEDSVSWSSSQYFIILGLVKESSIAIGLHKDPIYYGIPTEAHLANLRRRIWFTVASLDTEAQLLGGCLSTLPIPSETNVNFPVMSFKTPLEQAEIDELTKDSILSGIYNGLCHDVNNLSKKPELSSITDQLNEATSYVEKHYLISNLSDLRSFEVDSQLYKANAYKNHKILEKHFTLSSVKITVLKLILGHYEESRFVKLEIYKEFLMKYSKEVFRALDISGGLLSDAFATNLNPLLSNFAIYPFTTHISYKLINSLQAMLMNIFHGQDLMICHLYTSSSNVHRDYYEQFVAIIFNILDNYIDTVKQSVGSKNYDALRIVSAANINNYFLKAHTFFGTTRFCNHYDNIDRARWSMNEDQFWNEAKEGMTKGNSSLERGLFSVHTRWLRLSSSYRIPVAKFSDKYKRDDSGLCISVVNASKINQFSELNKDEIDTLIEIFSQKPQYCQTLTVWTARTSNDIVGAELGQHLNAVMQNFGTQPAMDKLMNEVLKEANNPDLVQRDVTADSLDALDLLFK
ncbi:Peroxisome proliferation transcriptional regulator [Wickerhamomyces ciferrii]|uniref:Peroxisome proliferation transcriptional regulator n=1 Tax=Wickerhamomyces ciferrii (strain ATCC 14091 / BCRC 22168 / CBS 111 / JCM 3599 / NBRC 0793 / NRRL Y-1031 F-60-10) TaxID=1206466 RepID=K0KTY5_WICCF|nr:Peroxisome proliferation transcriptional regulator [Wickerhamomyces ciferrii]CCH45482.1 Peroxisome proliferation transcriptional regulator [Wickerhamomyces ciferrii]